MANMFNNATNFNSDISRWNTSNVTNMIQMFYSARSFNKNIGGWNTSNVTNMFGMFGMFENATVFNNGQSAGGTTQPMNWTISFIGKGFIFSDRSALQNANKPQFYDSFDFKYSFNYTGSTPIADINNATYIPIITDSDKIRYNRTLSYSGSTVTVTITYTLINGIETTNDGLSFERVANFYNVANRNVKIINFGKIPLSRGGSQFMSLKSLTIEDTRSPNILTNTSMINMFADNAYHFASNFNSDISRWNTSNVTNMSGMFARALAFNQNIGSWDTSKVTNMTLMFVRASAFNKNIGNWNTSKVTNINNMSGMFVYALAFNNGDVPGGVTQPMNWIISFSGRPPNFSTGSALQTANMPPFR
jgi:surface protein